jgi:hypothetical protein
VNAETPEVTQEDSPEESRLDSAWDDLKTHIFVWDQGSDEPWEQRQARAKKTLYAWVMALRSYMFVSAWTFISAMFLITMHNIRAHWNLPRLQTATAQLIMALAVLTIFPSLTSYSTRRVIWVMAFRYLTEGYATFLAMYLIPYVLGEYLDKALQNERELKRQHIGHGPSSLDIAQGSHTSTLDIAQVSHDPTRLSMASRKEIAESRSRTDIVRTVAMKPKAARTPITHFHTSKEHALRPRKMVILQPAPLSLVFLLCCARPLLCIVRGLFSALLRNMLGSDEVWFAFAVTFNVLNLTTILGSLGLGWFLVRRTYKHLAEYVPRYQQIGMMVSILPLLGACQDLMVAWLYGAEGLGISFAGLLYLHEVVAVFGFVSWLTLAENQTIVQLRGVEEVGDPPKWSTWFIQLLNLKKTFYNSEDWPADTEEKAIKTVSVLCRWVLADSHLSFVKDKGNGGFRICSPSQLTHH